LAQDDILARAAAAIVPQLFLAERLRAERRPPDSLNTWECMVRALSLMNSRDRHLVATARQLMQRAVALDPHSARATGLLSFIATLCVHQGWQKRKREIPRALQIAHNALGLNSEEPWAHLALGYAKIWVRPEEAMPELQKALSLDPNLAIAHYLIALASAWAGQGEIALRHADMAERLNPRDLLARGNAGAHNNVRATACFAMERYREGIEFARKTIIDSPAMPTAHRALLINSALAGETEEARAALQKLLQLSPHFSRRWIKETAVWTREDDYRKYIEAFSMAGLE
jgi:tetratricopeptide (TPR) repeat protein